MLDRILLHQASRALQANFTQASHHRFAPRRKSFVQSRARAASAVSDNKRIKIVTVSVLFHETYCRRMATDVQAFGQVRQVGSVALTGKIAQGQKCQRARCVKHARIFAGSHLVGPASQ